MQTPMTNVICYKGVGHMEECDDERKSGISKFVSFDGYQFVIGSK